MFGAPPLLSAGLLLPLSITLQIASAPQSNRKPGRIERSVLDIQKCARFHNNNALGGADWLVPRLKEIGVDGCSPMPDIIYLSRWNLSYLEPLHKPRSVTQ